MPGVLAAGAAGRLGDPPAGASALARGAPAGRCAHSRRSGGAGPDPGGPPRPSAVPGVAAPPPQPRCSVGEVSAPPHCAGANTVHLLPGGAHLWVPTAPGPRGRERCGALVLHLH